MARRLEPGTHRLVALQKGADVLSVDKYEMVYRRADERMWTIELMNGIPRHIRHTLPNHNELAISLADVGDRITWIDDDGEHNYSSQRPDDT